MLGAAAPAEQCRSCGECVRDKLKRTDKWGGKGRMRRVGREMQLGPEVVFVVGLVQTNPLGRLLLPIIGKTMWIIPNIILSSF